jgi:hypothetical protein
MSRDVCVNVPRHEQLSREAWQCLGGKKSKRNILAFHSDIYKNMLSARSEFFKGIIHVFMLHAMIYAVLIPGTYHAEEHTCMHARTCRFFQKHTRYIPWSMQCWFRAHPMPRNTYMHACIYIRAEVWQCIIKLWNISSNMSVCMTEMRNMRKIQVCLYKIVRNVSLCI